MTDECPSGAHLLQYLKRTGIPRFFGVNSGLHLCLTIAKFKLRIVKGFRTMPERNRRADHVQLTNNLTNSCFLGLMSGICSREQLRLKS